MIDSFRALEIATQRTVLEPDRSLTAGTWTGYAEVRTDVGLEMGVWEHGVGSSRDTFGDEVFVVLAGRGTVRCDDGRTIALEPGVVGILHEGDVTTWEITEPLRKVWLVRAEPGSDDATP